MQSESPLIARLTAEGKPATQLRRPTREAVERLRAAGYREAPNPCLCRGLGDVLIARRDRFGLPLDTRLCISCGLMRTDPYLDDESIVRFYREVYRDMYTTGWLELTPDEMYESQQWAGRQVLQWLDEQSVATPGRVFDVGTGAGGMLASFRGAGSEVVGCDFDDRYLDVGRAAGLHLETGPSGTLLQYGQADMVLLSHVLEHFRDPVSHLTEIRALMKPDGLLYVEVPGIFTIRRAYKTIDAYLMGAHVWHFVLGTLDYVMGLAGFERVRGDEFVRAVYRQGPGAVAETDESTSEAVLAYLRHTERVRFFPRLTSPLVSLAPMARRLLGKRLYRRLSQLYARGTRKQAEGSMHLPGARPG